MKGQKYALLTHSADVNRFCAISNAALIMKQTESNAVKWSTDPKKNDRFGIWL